MDPTQHIVEVHLSRIEERVDEVYDRVSDVRRELHLLKWKVGSIASIIGAIAGSIATWVIGKIS